MNPDHHHEHDHPSDAAFWDALYQRRHHGSPENDAPNPVLAQEFGNHTPGEALDLGCGEGADALWLAQRGWQVTAVDVSNVALDRARAADAAGRVNWLQADMRVWQPPADAYDLISLHYVHIPPAERASLFGQLARALRPNGNLLVVAHHPSDHASTIGRPAMPSLYFTAEEVAALLTPGHWELRFSGTRPRRVTNPHGQSLTLQDMVLIAQRMA